MNNKQLKQTNPKKTTNKQNWKNLIKNTFLCFVYNHILWFYDLHIHSLSLSWLPSGHPVSGMHFGFKKITASFQLTLSMSLGWISSCLSCPSEYFWIAGHIFFLPSPSILFWVSLWLGIQLENITTQHTWAFLLQLCGLVVRKVRRKAVHQVLFWCAVGKVKGHSQGWVGTCFFWTAVQTELSHMILTNCLDL